MSELDLAMLRQAELNWSNAKREMDDAQFALDEAQRRWVKCGEEVDLLLEKMRTPPPSEGD